MDLLNCIMFLLSILSNILHKLKNSFIKSTNVFFLNLITEYRFSNDLVIQIYDSTNYNLANYYFQLPNDQYKRSQVSLILIGLMVI